MGNGPKIPAGWTEPERWVWERIAAAITSLRLLTVLTVLFKYASAH